MKIPDFQTLLQHTRTNGQFEISTSWFIFQRKIISEVYGDFKDRDAFTIYLYLCKHYRIKNDIVLKSKRKINEHLRYVKKVNGKIKYSAKVKRSLEWLEKEGFIERISNHKQKWYRSRILVAPDFDVATQQFVHFDQFGLELGNLKDKSVGYIMLPDEAIKHSMLANTTLAKRGWTMRKLKTLLLLYAYCWLEFYGGIDPNTVIIDRQGHITVNPRFCYALRSSPQQAIKTVLSLIKLGLFKPVECLFEEGVYMGDIGTYTPKSSSTSKIVLRPKYLLQHRLTSDSMKIKKGALRV